MPLSQHPSQGGDGDNDAIVPLISNLPPGNRKSNRKDVNDMSAYETILLAAPETGIAQITMNHPASLNALSGQTVEELARAIDELEKDDAVRVVVMTGAGKAFVAGADIAYMSKLTAEEARVFSLDTDAVYEKIRTSKKIYIAAVNGFALGGGCELALACDLCLASEYAKFGLPEVGLGILPGGGGTQRLPLRVGAQRAKELILTGDHIRADEAREIGLALKVYAAEELLPGAYDLARRILKNSPLAVKYAKECIQCSEKETLLPGIEYENALFGLCFAAPDQREGMAAFLEKRKPDFRRTF